MHASQDVQEFQRDIALDRLSSVIQEQARRKVTLVNNESTKEHTVEKTLKQTVDRFMQNLAQMSKVDDVKDQRVR